MPEWGDKSDGIKQLCNIRGEKNQDFIKITL